MRHARYAVFQSVEATLPREVVAGHMGLTITQVCRDRCDRRAKVINAEGEAKAAEKLVEASATLAREEGAMQLRYLEALHSVAQSQGSTTVFPLPMKLLERLSSSSS